MTEKMFSSHRNLLFLVEKHINSVSCLTDFCRAPAVFSFLWVLGGVQSTGVVELLLSRERLCA